MKALKLAIWAALLAGAAWAQPQLGSRIPAWPGLWPRAESYLVAVYSFRCGDLSGLWKSLLSTGLPIVAVNAGGGPTPAPAGLKLLRGAAATKLSDLLEIGNYPTVLLIQGGRVLDYWSGSAQISRTNILGLLD